MPSTKLRVRPTLEDRASGLLLHPTSLPGRHGSGDLGREARAFVDFLAAAGQRWWQMLPVGPAGYGDSPYSARVGVRRQPAAHRASTSSVDDGLARSAASRRAAALPARARRLRGHGGASGRAVCARPSRVRARSAATRRALRRVLRARARGWLDDFALFRALKRAHGGVAVDALGAGAPRRASPRALARARASCARRDRLRAVRRSTRSTRSGARCAPTRTSAASASSATCRSSSPTTAPTSGSTRELFYLDDAGEPTRRRRRAARLLQRHRPALGQPALPLGAHARGRATPGGSSASARRCAASTPSASITSSASSATGRSPASEPTAVDGPLDARARAPTSSTRVARALGDAAAHRRGSRRGHAGGRTRCATASSCPGIKILQFAFGDDPSGARASCRTTTRAARRLHRHARQRHHRRLVSRSRRRPAARARRRRPRRSGERALALPRQRRASEIHWDMIRARARVGRQHRDHPGAGPARPRLARRA